MGQCYIKRAMDAAHAKIDQDQNLVQAGKSSIIFQQYPYFYTIRNS
jgi:hypothetical protein